MDIKPIKAKAKAKAMADYRATLKELESLVSARANPVDDERLDVPLTLVEATRKNTSRSNFPIR